MAAVGICCGLKVDAVLAGGLGQRVGEQAGGSASLAQDKDTTAVERCIGGCPPATSVVLTRRWRLRRRHPAEVALLADFFVHRLAGGALFLRCHACSGLGDGSGWRRLPYLVLP